MFFNIAIAHTHTCVYAIVIWPIMGNLINIKNKFLPHIFYTEKAFS